MGEAGPAGPPGIQGIPGPRGGVGAPGVVSHDFSEYIIKIVQYSKITQGKQPLQSPLGGYALKYETCPTKKIHSVHVAGQGLVDGSASHLTLMVSPGTGASINSLYLSTGSHAIDSIPVAAFAEGKGSTTTTVSLTSDIEDIYAGTIKEGTVLFLTVKWD